MAFKPSPEQNKPSKDDQLRKDEYGGRYQAPDKVAGEEQKFGSAQNPVIDDPLMAKNLRKVGASGG